MVVYYRVMVCNSVMMHTKKKTIYFIYKLMTVIHTHKHDISAISQLFCPNDYCLSLILHNLYCILRSEDAKISNFEQGVAQNL